MVLHLYRFLILFLNVTFFLNSDGLIGFGALLSVKGAHLLLVEGCDCLLSLFGGLALISFGTVFIFGKTVVFCFVGGLFIVLGIVPVIEPSAAFLRAASLSAIVFPGTSESDSKGFTSLVPRLYLLPGLVLLITADFNFAVDEVGSAIALSVIGFLDKASALTLRRPGLYTNLYCYSRRRVLHLISR